MSAAISGQHAVKSGELDDARRSRKHRASRRRAGRDRLAALRRAPGAPEHEGDPGDGSADECRLLLSYFTLLADRQFSEVYSKGALGRIEPDGAEFGQFFFLYGATFIGCENQHHQYLCGLLDDDAYRGYEATIREQIAAFPGVRAMWQLVKHTYGSEFVKFLDRQIADTDAHAHRSIHKEWRALL